MQELPYWIVRVKMVLYDIRYQMTRVMGNIDIPRNRLHLRNQASQISTNTVKQNKFGIFLSG